MGPDALAIEVVVTLTLSLVLFLDAVNIEIVRDERIPRSIRQVLKIEAGTNDMVILPVVLLLIALARSQVGDTVQWPIFLGKLLLLGPAIGFAVGGIGSWVLGRVDSHWGIRREYQAVYGLGLVLAAYASSTASGGDGFLGAFSAGLAVVLLNQRLCDCFLEYGEVTSEMAMLLAFVLFGAVLIEYSWNRTYWSNTSHSRSRNLRYPTVSPWTAADEKQDELGGQRVC